MHRASNAFSVLQATAAIVAMATILWSLGASSIRFAEAAAVTSYSDTLSTSAPSVAATHTVEFTTPTGVANGETITIDFGPNFSGTTTITAADITVSTTTGATSVVAASCGAGTDQVGAAFGANDSILTLTFCSAATSQDYVSALGTTTITIGGTNQLTNPTAGSYEIDLTAGDGADTGSTRVAIVDTVTVTASVDTVFNFTVSGVNNGLTVNGTTTGTTTSATEIGFGQLVAGIPRTGAQDLQVTTNAKNGFVVTVVSDGQLDSQTGADIDGFANGNFDSAATPWVAPSASVGSEETYGHWGITSDDPTVTAGLTDEFDTAGDGQDYVSASTSPVEVFRHTGPTDGTGTGQGTTRVGYTVQISSLQEAATDYQAVLTYIATPVF